MEESEIEDQFEKEIGELEAGAKSFESSVRNKKLLAYAVRTGIVVVLYVLFWEHKWVRQSLWIYVPINLAGLLAIFLLPRYMRHKTEGLRRKLEETDFEEEEDPQRRASSDGTDDSEWNVSSSNHDE